MTIVFVHGWGCCPRYWDPLANLLGEYPQKRVDFGYTLSVSSDLPEQIDAASIFVAHSFGTMWALKRQYIDMRGLVAINGFPCFQMHTDERVLRGMMLRLKREPEKQMQEFWDNCGLPSLPSLSTDTLIEGLECLKDWNCKTELENLSCPVMSLIGTDDPILRYDVMLQDWQGSQLHIAEGGGHSLPTSDAQWCADKIKTFINAL